MKKHHFAWALFISQQISSTAAAESDQGVQARARKSNSTSNISEEKHYSNQQTSGMVLENNHSGFQGEFGVGTDAKSLLAIYNRGVIAVRENRPEQGRFYLKPVIERLKSSPTLPEMADKYNPRRQEKLPQNLDDTFVLANAYFYRGRANLLLADYNCACADLDEAIRHFPRFASALSERAKISIHRNKLDEAESLLDRAIKLDPANPDSFVARAMLDRRRGRFAKAAIDERNAKNLEIERNGKPRFMRTGEALDRYMHNFFSLAIARHPQNTQLLKKRSVVSQRMGLTKECIEDINRVIKIDPKDATALRSRGVLLSNAGQKRECLRDFAAAYALDRDEKSYLVAVGAALTQLKDTAGAIKAYKQLIKRYPADANYHSALAFAYFIAGDYQRAIDAATLSISLDSRNGHAFLTRGASYIELGKYKEALDDSNSVLKYDRGRAPMAYNNRALAYKGLRRFDLAKADFDRAISLSTNSDLPDLPYRNRGELLARGGCFEQSVADLAKAASLQKLRMKKADRISPVEFKSQIERYSKTLSVSKVNQDAYLGRGVLYLATEQLVKAASDFEQFIKLNGWQDKSCGYAAIYLSFVYRAQGRQKDANEILAKAEHLLKIGNRPTELDFLQGKIKEADLSNLKLSKDEATRIQCYSGMMKLNNGDSIGSLKNFQWVVDNGERCLPEYQLASAKIALNH
jgi:tetratricopeptide (TPR) repeat protein